MSESTAPVVSFDHLEVAYNENLVLHGISADIPSGQCVAITGSNGCGKSTLIKASLGISPVTGGEVKLFDAKVDQGSSPSKAVPWRKVGYVPQRMSVGGGVGCTVREVVETGLLSRGKWRLPRGSKKHVDAALERVGLMHREREAFQVLSGGQQQRALIARALVRSPSLYLMDEPLTGLDKHNREVLAGIIEQAKAGGSTLLIVLHELGELGPLIDRELRIHAGHIVHDGPCTHHHHEAHMHHDHHDHHNGHTPEDAQWN